MKDFPILTIRSAVSDLYEENVSDLINKGYTVKNCGFDGFTWWAVLLEGGRV